MRRLTYNDWRLLPRMVLSWEWRYALFIGCNLDRLSLTDVTAFLKKKRRKTGPQLRAVLAGLLGADLASAPMQ